VIIGCVGVGLVTAPVVVGIPNDARAQPDTSTCSEVSGRVNFNGLHVLPEAPMVGDEVELRFDVEWLVFSVSQMTLQGASPLLEGSTSLAATRDATFRLTAVESGTAFLELVVTYGTEEQCVDSGGLTYFIYGPDHTVTSDRYAVVIADHGLRCPGDCDGSGQVSIGELIEGVDIILGNQPLQTCTTLDRDDDGRVTVSELIAAVHAALVGCPPTTPTATPTPSFNPGGTPTNPPGRCCDCPAVSFVECQALAQGGSCLGWGDPCPTPSVGRRSAL
jgi:hypothetical protein